MQINRGKRVAPRRILLYGVHGVGKSTFAAGAPNPIFLNIEDGLNDLDVASTNRMRSFEEVIESLKWLYANDHDFYTLAIDTADWLEQLIFNEICRKAGKTAITEVGGGFRKGEDQALSCWRKVLELLDHLREHKSMSVIILAHAKVEKVNCPIIGQYDHYTLDLDKKAGPMLCEWSDEVLFARPKVLIQEEPLGFNDKNVKKHGIGIGERVLLTCDTPAAEAKNRLNLPKELPFPQSGAWDAYYQYVRAENETRRAAKPIESKPVGDLEGAFTVPGAVPQSEESKQQIAEMEGAFGG
jgi:hypothetical protein